MQSKWSYHLATLAILAGLALTIISWLELCTAECTEAHKWRVFGLHFEAVGLIFFTLLGALHFLRKEKAAAYLIAGGLGAEVLLIGFQYFVIGKFCPVCLSIAATIAVLALCYGHQLYLGGFMRSLKTNMSLAVLMLAGALITFGGLGKEDQLAAAEGQVKEQIPLGTKSSPIEVYVFTDWSCPACRQVEPVLEKAGPKIEKMAQLIFVDTVVHPETLSYAPFNLSFQIHNKSNYYKLREALTELSITNKSPTEKDVVAAIKSTGVKYQELDYKDVTLAMKWFEELTDKYKVEGTPSVVIINRNAKKGKKLAGLEEISEANILKTIESIR